VKEQELRIKLKQLAKDLRLRTPEVQMLLCQGRFLARLGSIPEGSAFIWKGGSLMLRLYRTEGQPRYTIDVDFSVSGISTNSVRSVLQKAMAIDLQDGFAFTSITSESMERDLPYGGNRYELNWTFFSKQGARKLKIDACAGDVVIPNIVTDKEAFLLPIGANNIEFRVYPKEFVFAEKLETIARFRTGNTRCKDFIDIWMLIQTGVEVKSLGAAIRMVFSNRGTSFSVQKIRDILTDTLFRDRLETHRKRHFADLDVPEIRKVSDDILELLGSLKM
jgi:predicted nucleotidyltransferase component of viral defense system